MKKIPVFVLSIAVLFLFCTFPAQGASLASGKSFDDIPFYSSAEGNQPLNRREAASLCYSFLAAQWNTEFYYIHDYKEQEREREEMHRLYGRPRFFSDVQTIAVDDLYMLGVVKGRSKDLYEPYADITREESAVLFQRMLNLYAAEGADLSSDIVLSEMYRDADAVSDWASDAVSLMARWDVFECPDNRFRPKDSISAEEFYRCLRILWEDADYTRAKGTAKSQRTHEEALQWVRTKSLNYEWEQFEEYLCLETGKGTMLIGKKNTEPSYSCYIIYPDGGLGSLTWPLLNGADAKDPIAEVSVLSDDSIGCMVHYPDGSAKRCVIRIDRAEVEFIE